MCAPVTFPNVDPEHWALIEAKLRAAGIQIATDKGTIAIDSTELQWDYQAATETLTVQCTHKLFVLPCGKVNATIQNLFFSTLRTALLRQNRKKP
jgi:hypothetical protein